MQRNQILKLSDLTFRVLSIVALLATAAIGAGIILWHTQPETLSGIWVSGNSVHYNFGTEKEASAEYVNELSRFSFYYLSVKYIAVMLSFFYIFQRARQVVSSIKSLKTFRNQNVRQFQKMGGAFTVLAVLDSFQFIQVGSSYSFLFTLPLSMLIAALLLFLLAEIFKEGNRLMEENHLTV